MMVTLKLEDGMNYNYRDALIIRWFAMRIQVASASGDSNSDTSKSQLKAELEQKIKTYLKIMHVNHTAKAIAAPRLRQ